jgi:cytosine/adenosine deaminase-related metal-dependent hydrolase
LIILNVINKSHLSYLKFQAENIFTGTEMLDCSKVLITNNKGIIEDIIDEKDAGENIQKHIGIISPGFINCHCHLELSHLKNAIPEQTGMVDFILKILQKRGSTEEIIQDAIATAEAEMIANGIVAVGDICNTTNTIYQKKKGKLHYHNFIEISGFVPQFAQQRFDAGLEVYNQFATHFPGNSTLVPHAPYSVSNDLFQLISKFSQNKIGSIHNQESNEENQFFEKATGDFIMLYKTLGIDISFFKPTHKSSLVNTAHHFSRAKKTIFVHNTFTSVNDLEKLNSALPQSSTQFYFCLCVLANRYINNVYPNLVVSAKNFENIVIGTDSLASNHSLNILKEINFMKRTCPHYSKTDLLRFATYNGANALGIEDKYGSFARGKQPGIVLIEDVFSTIKPIILYNNQH